METEPHQLWVRGAGERAAHTRLALARTCGALLALVACTPDTTGSGPADAPTVVDAGDTSLGGAQDIFTRRCAPMCHSGDMPTGDLSLEVGRAHADLIGVDTVSYCGADGIRVVPGDPDASCLWQLIRDDVMPLELPPMPPPAPLTPEEKLVIQAWIASGAPE